MVQGRQLAFLGNLQKRGAGINHPARAFGSHSYEWEVGIAMSWHW